MTDHDYRRYRAACDYLRQLMAGEFRDDRAERDVLAEVIAGLQSTDDPLLVPLYEALLPRWELLRSKRRT